MIIFPIQYINPTLYPIARYLHWSFQSSLAFYRLPLSSSCWIMTECLLLRFHQIQCLFAQKLRQSIWATDCNSNSWNSATHPHHHHTFAPWSPIWYHLVSSTAYRRIFACSFYGFSFCCCPLERKWSQNQWPAIWHLESIAVFWIS